MAGLMQDYSARSSNPAVDYDLVLESIHGIIHALELAGNERNLLKAGDEELLHGADQAPACRQSFIKHAGVP